MLNQEETQIINKSINSKPLRTLLTKESHYYFFNIYLAHYVEYETAPLHKEMFDITQDEKISSAVICAFRGSGKSTIMSLSYPLWAIMGVQQKKHVVITSRTHDMVKRIFDNLKKELEENKLLKQDLGPFKGESNKWGGGTLELTHYGARITVVSVEEGIRGIRHGKYRPDLIICDDVEDLGSTQNQTARDKTYNWFKGDLVPAGDKDTKVVVIGNLLHEDSLIMRLRKEIIERKSDGIFKSYPLLDHDGKCLWPGKYPTQKDIDKEMRMVANDINWSREYLLKIISDEERVVKPEWIQYWDSLPIPSEIDYVAIAIDLAVSEKSSADKTAIITGLVCNKGKEDMTIYILPDLINRKMDFPTGIELAKGIYRDWEQNYEVKLWVEDIGYQQAFIQEMQHQGIEAEGFHPATNKRSRLAQTTQKIKLGQILFPRKGGKVLINQLTGFGKERYDDLVDAFCILVLKAMEENKSNNDPIMIRGSLMPSTYLSPSGSDMQKIRRRRGALRYDMDNSDPLG